MVRFQSKGSEVNLMRNSYQAGHTHLGFPDTKSIAQIKKLGDNW